jgi:hypothetical protein
MSASCKFAIFLTAGMSLSGCLLLGGNPGVPNLRLIDRLHECIENRFADPAPLSLGMSRIARPSSFGAHFQPIVTSRRDFDPQNPAEKTAIAGLEGQQVQVGLYLFGAAVATSTADELNYRALKGPAAVTSGTPRPSWYPLLAEVAVPNPGGLPDWRAIYPVASRAMKSFEDGGKGFETRLDTWNLAARPVIATQDRCVSCHNHQAYNRGASVRLGHPVGGVIYAFRQVRN